MKFTDTLGGEWHIFVSLILGHVLRASGQFNNDLPSCSRDEAYQETPDNATVTWYVDNFYVVFSCTAGYKFRTSSEGILWCNWSTGKWSGNNGVCLGELQNNPCDSFPCQNGGTCNTSEDPYGWGYYCYCSRQFGGRHCHISDPCTTIPCPAGTTYCYRSYTSDAGRFCYSSEWRFLD